MGLRFALTGDKRKLLVVGCSFSWNRHLPRSVDGSLFMAASAVAIKEAFFSFGFSNTPYKRTFYQKFDIGCRTGRTTK